MGNKMTAAQKRADKEAARDDLRANWGERVANPQSLTVFRTRYGKGETDYVTAHIYYVGNDGRIREFPLTALIARAWGMTLKRTPHSTEIAIGGGGVSKSYTVALKLFDVLGIEHRETDINFDYKA